MLDQAYINRANAASYFNAGDSINRDAENTVARFDAEFQSGDYTQGQTAYLAERREQWRAFVLDHYNDQCRRRADYVPVSVCGPARYPAKKMEQRVDKIMSLAGEFSEKTARFFSNTRKRLEEMKPLEVKLVEIYAGEAKREPIQGSDPHIVEKLEAKLAGLEKRQEQMKTANKIMRAHKTPEARIVALVAAGWTPENAQNLLVPDCFGTVGFAGFHLTNNNATIKATRARLEHVKAKFAAPSLRGWDFDGGEVVANTELDRLQIIFDSRPNSEMIVRLKRAAFRWSPRNMAWQRQLTANAICAAKQIVA